jgi:transcriptional regulator with XRE-family HTH domain
MQLHFTYNLSGQQGRNLVMRTDRLKATRVKAGHTQESLAELLETDKRAISRWESGTFTPNTETLVRLAKILGVSADYLLGLSDDPLPHMRIDNMTEDERRVVAAMRHGDKLEAIRVIANDE